VEDGMKILALAGELLNYFDSNRTDFIITCSLALFSMFIPVHPFSSNEFGVNY
jgi:hypothetical protein